MGVISDFHDKTTTITRSEECASEQQTAAAQTDKRM
jgi:hypothetical protein